MLTATTEIKITCITIDVDGNDRNKNHLHQKMNCSMMNVAIAKYHHLNEIIAWLPFIVASGCISESRPNDNSTNQIQNATSTSFNASIGGLEEISEQYRHKSSTSLMERSAPENVFSMKLVCPGMPHSFNEWILCMKFLQRCEQNHMRITNCPEFHQ